MPPRLLPPRPGLIVVCSVACWLRPRCHDLRRPQSAARQAAKTLTDPCLTDRTCLGPWIPGPFDADPDGLRLNAFDDNGAPL
jgi:hypothetical protein